MFIDKQRPVASFLKGTLFLAVCVTFALGFWLLKSESGGAKFCAPGGSEIFGVCRPNAAFAGEALIWLALIYGALASPIVSVLVLKKLLGPKD
ncbi:MAG: hypothetical protein VW268_11950 [Rhodospirillaceae bacterium]